MGMRYTICHWAINRSDPQNLLSVTLDVPRCPLTVVLRYKTHSERTLLTVSSLRRQNMILGYTWLKDYNPEVNWQTREVQMN